MDTRPSDAGDKKADNALRSARVSLLQQTVFGALPKRALEELADCCTPAVWPAGLLIYQQPVAVLDRGLVRAFVTDGGGRQLTTAYFHRASTVGLSRVAGRIVPLGFQAVTETAVLQLASEEVNGLFDSFPTFGRSIAKEMVNQYDKVLGEVSRVAFGSMRQRVAFHLSNLTSIDDGGPEVRVHPRDLAQAVGTVREVIRRTIIECQESGLVDVTPEGIGVTDRARLQRIANAPVERRRHSERRADRRK